MILTLLACVPKPTAPPSTEPACTAEHTQTCEAAFWAAWAQQSWPEVLALGPALCEIDGRACLALGEAREALGDPDGAMDWYDRACAHDWPAGCTAMGLAHQRAEAERAEPSLAEGWLLRGCRGGDPAGCASLGWIQLQRGEAEGEALLIQACRDEVGFACDRLGQHARACELGEPAGCVNQGLVTSDPTLAAALFTQGCDAGLAEGCANLAVLERDGRGVPQDTDAAREHFSMACGEGLAESCAQLGTLLSDPVGQLSAADRGCDLGSAAACYRAGQSRLRGEVLLDEETAARDFERACALGEPEGCNAWGTLLEGEAAALAFERACDGGSWAGCTNWALQQQGDAPASARELFSRSCAAGEPHACAHLGVDLELGRGGPRDLDGAREAYEAACQAGVQVGCENLGRL